LQTKKKKKLHQNIIKKEMRSWEKTKFGPIGSKSRGTRGRYPREGEEEEGSKGEIDGSVGTRKAIILPLPRKTAGGEE